MNTSIYLSQSYKDAWDEYKRSLSIPTFPVWDYIVLTASNDHQAKSFSLQIESRKDYLPKHTKIGIVPDEGGVRVGSGGATLSVLKWLKEHGGWENKRVLVIHSGGDSKRVPQYSALGKLFSPVPHVLPDGRNSTLFDELIIAMSAVSGRMSAGMLLLSGDVLPLFNPLLLDWNGSGAAVVSFKEDVETGKNHGVYLRGADGNVKAFLHKQSVDVLRSVGAVNEKGCIDIDTGAILFGVDVLNSLFSLISTDGIFDPGKYNAFVNNKVRLSLYGDFQYPLATDATLTDFFSEKPEGEYSEELKACREAVWNALHSYNLKLLRLAPAKFIHFGTTSEVLRLMDSGVDDYADFGWSRCVHSIGNGYNSVISPRANVGEGVYAEVSYIHGKATVGPHSIVSYIDIHDEVIPDHVVLHGLKQTNGKFVCRIYGVDDNPKENKLFGHPIPATIAPDLWSAPIYPEKGTIREAVAAALKLYKLVQAGAWDRIESGKSLSSGFNDADAQAIFAWNKRMAELVEINEI
ncbi:MAG: bifunctional fucokinase/L-fucose-1-P-guanylyltransferase, partial [Clostridia bacterium]|nr:bifunctional fucokinase/L-fucose-1-P-guanylyltransferase [Clostridia bacterium]